MGASLKASICQCQIELECVGRSLKASVYQNRSIICSSPSSTLSRSTTCGFPRLSSAEVHGSAWAASMAPGHAGLPPGTAQPGAGGVPLSQLPAGDSWSNGFGGLQRCKPQTQCRENSRLWELSAPVNPKGFKRCRWGRAQKVRGDLVSLVPLGNLAEEMFGGISWWGQFLTALLEFRPGWAWDVFTSSQHCVLFLV